MREYIEYVSCGISLSKFVLQCSKCTATLIWRRFLRCTGWQRWHLLIVKGLKIITNAKKAGSLLQIRVAVHFEHCRTNLDIFIPYETYSMYSYTWATIFELFWLLFYIYIVWQPWDGPKNCLTLFFSIPGHMANTSLVEFGQKLILAKGVTLAAHPGQTHKEC